MADSHLKHRVVAKEWSSSLLNEGLQGQAGEIKGSNIRIKYKTWSASTRECVFTAGDLNMGLRNGHSRPLQGNLSLGGLCRAPGCRWTTLGQGRLWYWAAERRWPGLGQWQLAAAWVAAVTLSGESWAARLPQSFPCSCHQRWLLLRGNTWQQNKK